LAGVDFQLSTEVMLYLRKLGRSQGFCRLVDSVASAWELVQNRANVSVFLGTSGFHPPQQRSRLWARAPADALRSRIRV
jgi:hypothetical protein